MQFSTLLEELVKAGKIQKQALSAALSYSPSEISKYLAGTRLPSPSASQEWIDRCAAFFAQVFWENGLGDGFTQLFPMFIPIRKQQELEALIRAALNDSYRVSNSGAAAQAPDDNHLLLGWDEIIRALVLSMSQAARHINDLHTSFSLEMYLELLQRRSLPLPASTWQGTCKQSILVSPLGSPDMVTLSKLGLLVEHWQSNHDKVDLQFFAGPMSVVSEFAYIPEQFACMLVNSLSQTPVGTLMRSPRYLLEYGIVNKMLHTLPCSYTSLEGQEAFEAKEEEVLRLLAGCEGIFAFDSVSFFATEEHLAQVPGAPSVKEKLARALALLTNRSIPMLVTMKAVEHFSNAGEALVPLLGTLKMKADQSTAYMMAYADMMQDPNRLKVSVTKRSFAQCTILVLKRYLMVLIPFTTEEQRLLVLPRSVCEGAVQELFDLLKTDATQVTQDLWEHYLRYLPSMRRSMEPFD